MTTPPLAPPIPPTLPKMQPQPPRVPAYPPTPPQPTVLHRHAQRGLDVEVPLQSPTPEGHIAWDQSPTVVPRVPDVSLKNVTVPDESTWWPDTNCFMHTGTDTVRRVLEDTYLTCPPQRVAADIETHGTTGRGKWEITCITFAFRAADGSVHSVLLNPLRSDEDRGMVHAIIDRATTVVFHNAPFDIPIMYAHRLISFSNIRKVEDTLLLARQLKTISKGQRTLEALAGDYGIAEDSTVGILNAFKAQNETKEQGYASGDIDAVFYRRGAMSDTAATLQLWDKLYVAVVNEHAIGQPGVAPSMLTLPEAHELVAKVQRAGQVTLQMSATGLNWDAEHMERWIDNSQKEVDKAEALLKDSGLDPGNGAQLIAFLDEQGLIPDDWPRTDKGALKADKKAMKLLSKQDNELAAAHTVVAEHAKNLNYMVSTKETAEFTGRVHAGNQILGAHATGRMCLAYTASILTKRGVLTPDEVRPGDVTPDHTGQWTHILNVHHFRNADVYTYPTAWGKDLRCTPEHRWVHKNTDGTTSIHPLFEGTATIMATPPAEHTRTSHLDGDFPDPGKLTPAELRATLIGWIVAGESALVGYNTDTPTLAIGNAGGVGQYLAEIAGRAFDDGEVEITSNEVTAFIKRLTDTCPLFDLLARVCASSYSTAASAADMAESIAAGFDASSSQAFLQSVILAGIIPTPRGLPKMRVPATWSRAVTMACYRAGLDARAVDFDGTNHLVCLLDTDGLVEVYAGDATHTSTEDVWCVTTSSGTFTYFEDGMFMCTGNSVNDPPLQQFSEDARPIICADEGEEFWSVDWSSIEPVVLANMAGDRDFIEPFNNGGDLYIPLARKAGLIPPSVSDADAAHHPGRKKAKRVLLAAMYGQGLRSLSEEMGISVDEARGLQQGLRRAMEVTWSFMESVTRHTERTGFSYTIWGRMMDERLGDAGEIKTHVAVNHFCQGSAADVLMDTVLRLDDAGVGHRIKMLIHDELVVTDKDVELTKQIMQTPPKALAERARITPVLRVDAQYMGKHWLKV